jgi:diaminohydroxyphosphoribosylaminopyrimidine deaminase / 5-amino-6-(5-phosphoribosylamino)uracil reductase
MDDHYFMKMALSLAYKGSGFTSPNPAVGAVIVKNGVVVGKGYHRAAGKPHAEIEALNDAGDTAKDAVLYVTLEPCNHFGRTPPCTEKILNAGIKHVVIAMKDPNPNVKGGGIETLKAHGIKVSLNILKKEAEKLNEAFIFHTKNKRPFVTLKCAATLDGRIATSTGNSKWITGPESRKYVHQLRHSSDAIMVGLGTVLKDDPSLTTRLEKIRCQDPKRIILDSHLKIPEKARLLNLNSPAESIIVTTEGIAKARRKKIEDKGARIITATSKNKKIDLYSLMDQLGAMHITSLLIEGGSRLIYSALTEKIVNKILFFYAPKILCGDDGIPISTGIGAAMMDQSLKVRNINVRRFDDDVLIEGYLK